MNTMMWTHTFCEKHIKRFASEIKKTKMSHSVRQMAVGVDEINGNLCIMLKIIPREMGTMWNVTENSSQRWIIYCKLSMKHIKDSTLTIYFGLNSSCLIKIKHKNNETVNFNTMWWNSMDILHFRFSFVFCWQHFYFWFCFAFIFWRLIYLLCISSSASVCVCVSAKKGRFSRWNNNAW